MKIKNNKIKYFNEKNVINKYLLRKNYLKSFFIFFKYISVFACIFFLGNEIFINYLDILENLKSNYFLIFLIFFFSIIFQNLINIRHFFLLKYSLNYSYSFLDWSRLFFYTAILNKVIFFSGYLYRATELKKRGVNYRNYISLIYISFFFGLLVNLILLSIEFTIISINNLFILIITLVILLVSLIYFTPKNIIFLLKFIKIKNSIFIKKWINYVFDILNILRKSFKYNKNIKIFIFFTIIIHLVELSIFYFSGIVFLSSYSFSIIIALFAASIILTRIPFIYNITGLCEIILGTIGVSMGVFFIDAALIQLLIRINIYLSVILNTGIFFITPTFDKKNL